MCLGSTLTLLEHVLGTLKGYDMAHKQAHDDTLGTCGCVDYHYADCPTRDTYAYAMDTEYGIDPYDIDPIEPDPIPYDECNHSDGFYLSEVAGFHCDVCDSDFIGPLFFECHDSAIGLDWYSFFK